MSLQKYEKSIAGVQQLLTQQKQYCSSASKSFKASANYGILTVTTCTSKSSKLNITCILLS